MNSNAITDIMDNNILYYILKTFNDRKGKFLSI